MATIDLESTPDTNGWIKSSIETPQEPTYRDPKEQEARAQFEKISRDWPQGRGEISAYGDETGFGDTDVQIDLFIDGDLATVTMLQDQMAASWPAGYPNQEQVSVCGADKDEMNVFWVQNKTLVRLSRGADMGLSGLEDVKPVNLKDYADAVWQVVHGMRL